MGKPELGYEAHADLASLQDDAYSFRTEAERAPSEIRYFIGDVMRDCRFLAVDVAAEARAVTRHLASLFQSDRSGDASDANHS